MLSFVIPWYYVESAGGRKKFKCPDCLSLFPQPRYDDHIKKGCVVKHNGGQHAYYHRAHCWQKFPSEKALMDHKANCNFKIYGNKSLYTNICSLCREKFHDKSTYMSRDDHSCIRLYPERFVNFVDATK